jgi:protein TonB
MTMSLDLFRPSTDSRQSSRATPFVAWPFSIAAHVAVLGAALVIPLMATDVLPTPREVMSLMRAVPAPEPPPAPLPARPASILAQAIADKRLAPVNVPSSIGQETLVVSPRDTGFEDANRTQGGVVPGVELGGLDVPGSGIARPSVPETPVRPGGVIRRPEKIFDVRPVYPELAIRAKVQGMVIIEATIGRTGLVEDATVLRSVPLLDRPALDAVRQWRYTPTLLNGVPISIIMTVTVQFRLEAPK